MVYTFEVYFKGELIHEDDYAYNTVEEAEEILDEAGLKIVMFNEVEEYGVHQ